MTNRAVRDRLLASTIIAGSLIAATPAFAQEGNAPAGVQTSENTTPEPNSQGEIVVTGSLIRNPNLVASAPVAVLGQEELQLRQTNTAEQVLRQLPGAVADVGSAVNNGSGGSFFVNLRGLGSQRNLVLLDGNRIAPADLRGVVDLNNIPLALVQTTQILTGGASTTYGADAISGVVNFITKSDFSGIEAQASSQITAKGDGPYYRADITIGANFDDGRGNAVFSVGYQRSDPVYQGDRSFGRDFIDSFTGGIGGSGTTVPGRFGALTYTNPVTGVRSSALPGNNVINQATGAFRAYSGTTDAFNYNPYNVFQLPFQRYNIYGAGHYDVSDNLTLYTRGLFSKNSVRQIIAPSGAFLYSDPTNGVPFSIPFDNPYLPAAARQQLCSAFGLGTGANCGAGQTFTATIGRRAVEAGPRISNFVTQIFDYRAGLRGNITDGIQFDVNGSYGESTNTNNFSGYVRNTKFQDALLATNPTTCTSGASGCIPINAFGGPGTLGGTVNPIGALSYITSTSTSAVNNSLGQVRGVITGDAGFGSPLSSKKINFAVGAEYRKYTASQVPDALAASTNELGGNNGAVSAFGGSYDVTEGFGEIIAPLVEDKPFFKSLTLEAGIRYSHYHIDAPATQLALNAEQQRQLAGSPSIFATSDPSFNTTTWKVGGSWEPVDAIKVRGNFQHAVRAPNINELFLPPTSTLTTINVDPCGSGRALSSANLRAVCVAQGAPNNNTALAAIPEGPSASQGVATQYGSLNLRPEKSDSYTIGLVLNPRQLIPGLTATVDYYHIKIKDAISAATVGDIFGACFSNLTAASATSAACTSIRRSPEDGSFDAGVGIPLVLSNQGRYLTDGIDLSVNYRKTLGEVTLNASFDGNWTRRAIFQASPGSIARECVNYYSANCGLSSGLSAGGSIQPEFSWNQRTTLSFKNVDVSLLWRHINPVQQEPLSITDPVAGQGPTCGAPGNTAAGCAGRNFSKIPGFNYFDLSTRFSVGDHLEFVLTVQNLANKKPPIVGASIGTTLFNSGNTYPSTYDAVGRRFGMSARLKF